MATTNSRSPGCAQTEPFKLKHRQTSAANRAHHWWTWRLFGLLFLLALPAWALVEGRDGAWLGFALGVAVLLAWTHRANLQRLRAGNEHRFEKARVLARLWARSDA